MTRQKFVLAAAAAFAFSIGSAWAQERTAPTQDTGPSGGSRGGGEVVGHAVERSAPSPTSSSPSSSGSSDSGSATSSSSSSGSSGWDAPSRASEAPRRSVDAPQRSGQRATPRGSSGGSSSGERAVPRGSSGGSDSGDRGGRSAGTASTRGESGADRSGDRNVDRGRERSAVPVYARPREGRPAVGTAAERRGPIPGRGTIDVLYYPSSYYYYDPYYLRSRSYGSYWLPGYGYGLGYFGYDPFFWSNYGYYGGGYGYGGGYSGGGYSGYAYPAQRYDTGSVRLKVKPSHGQVYVDGYFVGEVDSFDGMFQRLTVEAGTHRIEIRAEGYEPVQFDVMVTPGETVTYKGEMIRRQP